MKAYKVVEKKTRHCSNWTLFKAGMGRYPQKKRNEWIRFRRDHKEFFPRYLKGKTIYAPKSSEIGILCFATLRHARWFKSTYRELKEGAIIIKVEGIGKRGDEFFLSSSVGSSPLNMFSSRPYTRPPLGSVHFDKVIVLE